MAFVWDTFFIGILFFTIGCASHLEYIFDIYFYRNLGPFEWISCRGKGAGAFLLKGPPFMSFLLTGLTALSLACFFGFMY